MHSWDAGQYLRFAEERTRPALDLLARIDVVAPQRVVDLGCGPGNSTALLRERWPDAVLEGLDSSQDMLAAARRDHPGSVFMAGDITTWQPAEPYDVVFSNAALQWVGDHAGLLPRLVAAVRQGGVLAVQMPRNFGAKSHTSITETALAGPWRATLEPLLRPSPVAEPAVYYDLLAPRAASLDIWETEYLQVLDGVNPVKEWTKGTWLSPLLAALDEPERSNFEAAYGARVASFYPPRRDGKTLFPFRRMFLIAASA